MKRAMPCRNRKSNPHSRAFYRPTRARDHKKCPCDNLSSGPGGEVMKLFRHSVTLRRLPRPGRLDLQEGPNQGNAKVGPFPIPAKLSPKPRPQPARLSGPSCDNLSSGPGAEVMKLLRHSVTLRRLPRPGRLDLQEGPDQGNAKDGSFSIQPE